MKVSRFGKATPLNQTTYNLISDSFSSDAHKLFFAIAWYTGERPNAILRLDVNHIYADTKKRQSRESIIYSAPTRKDRTTREVHIHRALKLVLSAYQPPDAGFLFPSLYNPNEHLSRQAIDNAFRRALRKAHLDKQGFSLYSTRRGFITRLQELGYSIKLIQRLTGHKSLSSLITYIDVSDDQLKNAINNF